MSHFWFTKINSNILLTHRNNMITKIGVLKNEDMVSSITTFNRFARGYDLNAERMYIWHTIPKTYRAKQVLREVQEKSNQKENGPSKRSEIQFQLTNYYIGICRSSVVRSCNFLVTAGIPDFVWNPLMLHVYNNLKSLFFFF